MTGPSSGPLKLFHTVCAHYHKNEHNDVLPCGSGGHCMSLSTCPPAQSALALRCTGLQLQVRCGLLHDEHVLGLVVDGNASSHSDAGGAAKAAGGAANAASG